MRKRYDYYEKLNNAEYLGEKENEFIFDLFFAGCWIKGNSFGLCIRNKPRIFYTPIEKEVQFPLHKFNDSDKIKKITGLYVPSNIKELIKYNRKNSLEKNPKKRIVVSKINNNIDRSVYSLIL